MIDFRADWCSLCLKLEHETFPDPAVVEEAKRFVAARVDCTDSEAPAVKALWRKYGVVGLPTIVFIDSSGKRVVDQTVTEFVRAPELLKRMRAVK